MLVCYVRTSRRLQIRFVYFRRRRIVGAEMQHVVYKEWLPDILGPVVTTQHGLYPRKSGYTVYNASLDATIPNDFSGAAFRFGHSQINNTFLRCSSFSLSSFFV